MVGGNLLQVTVLVCTDYHGVHGAEITQRTQKLPACPRLPIVSASVHGA